MILNVNKYFFYFLLIVLINKNSFAQEYLDKQFGYANQLYNNKEFFNAITELKRLLYFDKENKYSYSANLMIGKCYKGGAKLDDAIKYFSLANYNSSSKEEYFLSKVEIVKCNILRRTTDQAKLLLEVLSSDPRFKDRIDEINYWRGWSFIFSDEYEKAASEFSKIDSNHSLKKLCEKADEERYSVLLAKIVTFVLPGAGQFYTGNYLSGLMSFAWNGLLLYLSIDSFLADRVFDGLVTTGLFFRFHRGNIQNAEKFVLEKNLEISNKMLIFLQENYTGGKP